MDVLTDLIIIQVEQSNAKKMQGLHNYPFTSLIVVESI